MFDRVPSLVCRADAALGGGEEGASRMHARAPSAGGHRVQRLCNSASVTLRKRESWREGTGSVVAGGRGGAKG